MRCSDNRGTYVRDLYILVDSVGLCVLVCCLLNNVIIIFCEKSFMVKKYIISCLIFLW